jgi:hypothetical protein
MKSKWIPTLRKIARIWSVAVFILGVLIFIAEISNLRSAPLRDYPWWENLMPISLLLAIAGLAVAWRREALGGGMAIGFCLLNLLLYLATGREQVGAVLLIMLPVVLPGVVFLVCAWWGRKIGD